MAHSTATCCVEAVSSSDVTDRGVAVSLCRCVAWMHRGRRTVRIAWPAAVGAVLRVHGRGGADAVRVHVVEQPADVVADEVGLERPPSIA
jgi:hypothetical protein